MAKDDEKQYFNPNKAPVWDAHHSQLDVDRGVWFSKLFEVDVGLTKKLVKKYLEKKARLQGEEIKSEEQLLKRFNKL